MRAPTAESSASAGFTLVEALAALAVVAAGLGALGALVHANALATLNAERRAALAEAARGVFESRLAGARTATLATNGADGGYAWTVAADAFAQGAAVGNESRWEPVHERIVVTGASGESIALDTVRLVARRAP